jgi:DNA-binding NarL/FixJ family response regulator
VRFDPLSAIEAAYAPHESAERWLGGIAFLAMGHAHKYVAYLLGLSPSTVAGHFASARRKLGVANREELTALFSSVERSRAASLASGRDLPRPGS